MKLARAIAILENIRDSYDNDDMDIYWQGEDGERAATLFIGVEPISDERFELCVNIRTWPY